MTTMRIADACIYLAEQHGIHMGPAKLVRLLRGKGLTWTVQVGHSGNYIHKTDTNSLDVFARGYLKAGAEPPPLAVSPEYLAVIRNGGIVLSPPQRHAGNRDNVRHVSQAEIERNRAIMAEKWAALNTR